jgi:16S rRNA (uracil1498-N3)-methyltransferase
MRIFRTYCSANSIQVGGIYQLLDQTSHHLSHVLRVKVGDLVEIFDGKGHCYRAKIESLQKRVSVKELEEKPKDKPISCEITLLVCVGKGEKVDWIVQKATELGVTQIIPVLSSRCEVRLPKERWQKKIEHWQEIALNACEQCGRNTIPNIRALKNFHEACRESQEELKLLLHPEERAKSMKYLLKETVSSVSLGIGPEGGWDEKEVALAIGHGFRLASLGPRILRMETAAIACVALTQALLGDL